MQRFWEWGKHHPVWFGFVVSALYGFVMRLVIYAEWLKDNSQVEVLGLASLGFLFGVPLVMGYLTLAGHYLKHPHQARSMGQDVLQAIFLPWTPAGVSCGVILIAGFELAICLIMAAPIFMLMSSIGGLLALIILRNRPQNYNRILAGLVFLPMVGSVTESQLPQPIKLYTVHNQIEIQAPPERVWQAIERVPSIQEHEQSHSYLHDFGFPRPLEATLSKEGVGGVRHATFEDNILFVETVTEWDPPRQLSFEIVPELAESQSQIVNPMILGGKYFDVLRGTYRLEPLANGNTLLHLSSQQRVSTFYNAYSSLWTRWVMSELQGYILNVIQARCEGERELN